MLGVGLWMAAADLIYLRQVVIANIYYILDLHLSWA